MFNREFKMMHQKLRETIIEMLLCIYFCTIIKKKLINTNINLRDLINSYLKEEIISASFWINFSRHSCLCDLNTRVLASCFARRTSLNPQSAISAHTERHSSSNKETKKKKRRKRKKRKNSFVVLWHDR